MDIAELLGVDRTDPDFVLAARLVQEDEGLIDALIELRRKRQLTQVEVGERMGGIGQSAVARIESGERDPHMSTLRRYALAVGADVRHAVAPFDREGPVSRRVEDRYRSDARWNAEFDDGRALNRSAVVAAVRRSIR